MKKILFVGLPGSGKGTQAQLLEKFGFKQISTGDIMREAWKTKEPLVMPHKESVEKGNLLPNNVVFELLEKNLDKLKGYSGYVLDGAIRNLNQAKIGIKKNFFDIVLFFSLNEKQAEKRLCNRKICEKCGRIYSVENKICEKCKIPLVKRKDDDQEAIMIRFNEYKNQTQPILTFLKQNIKDYHEVDASPSIEKIHKEVLKILKLK